MKHEYAGITIDLPYVVEFLSFDKTPPIFHEQSDELFERVKYAEAGARTGYYFCTKTKCGQILYAEDDGVVTDRARCWMPTRHAVRFARPCTSCWPELRAQRSLWSQPRKWVAGDAVPLPTVDDRLVSRQT